MFTELIARHYAWLRSQGWMTVETPLELLALVTSEVGEAVNECRRGEPSDRFAEELADIVLRTSAIAQRYGIDIEAAMAAKIAKNHQNGGRGRSI